MKSINTFINEKKATRDGSFEMIDSIINQLKKFPYESNKEIWKSCEAFLNDYLHELSEDDVQYIVDALGLEDFKISDNNGQAIANYIINKARGKI